MPVRYPYAEGLVELSASRAKARLGEYVAGRCAGTPVSWVVDLGCGDGELASAVARHLSGASRWVLLDQDDQQLRSARAAVGAAGAARVDAVCADVTRLPLRRSLPPGGLILAAHLLYYLSDWRDTLRSLLLARGSSASLVVVVRSSTSASFRLRAALERGPGGRLDAILSGEVVTRWLISQRIPLSIGSAVYHVRRELEDYSPSGIVHCITAQQPLRRLITFFCRVDPAALTATMRHSLAREISGMMNGGTLDLRFTDTVIVVPPLPMEESCRTSM